LLSGGTPRLVGFSRRVRLTATMELTETEERQPVRLQVPPKKVNTRSPAVHAIMSLL
jgi:hypothetical protein